MAVRYNQQDVENSLKNTTGRRSRGSTTRTSVDTTSKSTMNSGWSKNSKMHLRYIHLFNNQGSNAVLKAEGFVSDEGSEVEKLKPVYYRSNCNEANIKNAKWCMKCGMVLSFSGYQEALKEQKHKDEKINLIEKQLEAQSNQLKALISELGNINDQKQVNKMAQALYSSGILNVSSSKGGSKKFRSAASVLFSNISVRLFKKRFSIYIIKSWKSVPLQKQGSLYMDLI
jgi:hypothetical protein